MQMLGLRHAWIDTGRMFSVLPFWRRFCFQMLRQQVPVVPSVAESSTARDAVIADLECHAAVRRISGSTTPPLELPHSSAVRTSTDAVPSEQPIISQKPLLTLSGPGPAGATEGFQDRFARDMDDEATRAPCRYCLGQQGGR